ncbi:FUSC family protein [Caballeronia cordobensis]|uniref:FUSC family protein n=1 Tax=Caballeronia cordobensis TaxID=1353886 RepID=UPI00158EF3BD
MTVIGQRPRRIGRFDALRMCVQSLIASALTYACMNFIGSSSTTWGVFSSLFALQVSFDRSLKYGVGQMIGAAIGTAVGLATLHFFPDAANAFPRLALATLVTCLASTLFPTTNYSIVVAASLALSNHPRALQARCRARKQSRWVRPSASVCH